MRRIQTGLGLALVAALVSVTSPAYANMIWPAGLQAINILFWSVPIGLLVEWAIVRWVFIPDSKTALRAVAWANAASTLIGILCLPISTSIVADVATSMAGKPYGEAHDAACLLVYAPFAAIFSAIVEWAVLTKWFAVPATNRTLGVMVAANAVTTAIAIFPAVMVLF